MAHPAIRTSGEFVPDQVRTNSQMYVTAQDEIDVYPTP